MSIRVICHKCRSTFQVKDKYAGRQGSCPVCRAVVDVPGISETSAHTAAWVDDRFDEDTLVKSSGASSRGATPLSQQPPSEKFEFPCPQCGLHTRVDKAYVGRKLVCKECKAKFRIPAPRASDSQAGSSTSQSAPTGSNPNKKKSSSKPLSKPAASRRVEHTPSSDLTPITGEIDDRVWDELPHPSKAQGPLSLPARNPNAFATPFRSSVVEARSKRKSSFRIPNWLKVAGGALAAIVLLCGTGARIAKIVNRAVQNSTQNAGNWSGAGGSDVSQLPLTEGSQVFRLTGAYIQPGANPRDLRQAKFVVDVSIEDRVPTEAIYLLLESPGGNTRMPLNGLPPGAKFDRWEVSIYDAPRGAAGPFSAWVESDPIPPENARRRISNTVKFQTVQQIPDFQAPIGLSRGF